MQDRRAVDAHYDPLAAFDSFTREELIAAIRMWIERCDRAESDRAELLAALQMIVPNFNMTRIVLTDPKARELAGEMVEEANAAIKKATA